jgi:hypothetical protein
MSPQRRRPRSAPDTTSQSAGFSACGHLLKCAFPLTAGDCSRVMALHACQGRRCGWTRAPWCQMRLIRTAKAPTPAITGPHPHRGENGLALDQSLQVRDIGFGGRFCHETVPCGFRMRFGLLGRNAMRRGRAGKSREYQTQRMYQWHSRMVLRSIRWPQSRTTTRQGHATDKRSMSGRTLQKPSTIYVASDMVQSRFETN